MAFWFLMCLSNEGHIRVATLRNHIIQNNAILKCIYPETQLPPYQALPPWKRVLRLLSYFLILLTMSSFMSMNGLLRLEKIILRRSICHKRCQSLHFPGSCDFHKNYIIEYQGNRYTNWFHFTNPLISSSTSSSISSSISGNITLLSNTSTISSLNTNVLDWYSNDTGIGNFEVGSFIEYDNCLRYTVPEPLEYNSCTPPKQYIHLEKRCERIDICFRGCKMPTTSTARMPTSTASQTSNRRRSLGEKESPSSEDYLVAGFQDSSSNKDDDSIKNQRMLSDWNFTEPLFEDLKCWDGREFRKWSTTGEIEWTKDKNRRLEEEKEEKRQHLMDYEKNLSDSGFDINSDESNESGFDIDNNESGLGYTIVDFVEERRQKKERERREDTERREGTKRRNLVRKAGSTSTETDDNSNGSNGEVGEALASQAYRALHGVVRTAATFAVLWYRTYTENIHHIDDLDEFNTYSGHTEEEGGYDHENSRYNTDIPDSRFTNSWHDSLNQDGKRNRPSFIIDEDVLAADQLKNRRLGGSIDTRPYCSSVEEATTPMPDKILCVAFNPSEHENVYYNIGTQCFESSTINDETGETQHYKWCIHASQIALAVLVANIFQFGYDLIFLFLAVLDEAWSFEDRKLKCFWQFVAIFSHFCMLLVTFGPINIGVRTYKSEAIWTTFGIAFFADQLKNFCIQPIIWWLVIRRCGRVIPGIQEHNDEYLLQWDLQESLLDEMQRLVREFLERKIVILSVIALVGFYAAFLMTSLVLADCWKYHKQDHIACDPTLCPGLDRDGKDQIRQIFTGIDLAIMLLFMMEILMKCFGYGYVYISDPWNSFDAVIVVASIISWFIFLDSTTGTTGLGLLRLLRLVRVLVLISDGRKKLKKMVKQGIGNSIGESTRSHVERVLDLLEKLQNVPQLQHLQMDLEWCLDVILENKLYKISVDAETNKTQGNSSDLQHDSTMAAWILQMGDSGTAASFAARTMDASVSDANSPQNIRSTFVGGGTGPGKVSHVGRAGGNSAVRGSFTRGSHTRGSYTRGSQTRGGSYTRGGPGGRGGPMGTSVRSMSRAATNGNRRPSEVQNNGVENLMVQLHIQLYSRSNLSQGEEEQIETTLRMMDDWSFDVLVAAEILDVNTIPVIILKLMICYDLIGALNLDFDLLFNWCTFAQERHKQALPFHGPAHSVHMAQSCHYFLQHGLDSLDFLTPFHKFALFFSTMCIYIDHPGLTNEFLIQSKHPRAIRYNDKAVNLHYSLSIVFQNLSDPELNFLLHMQKDAIEIFRKIIISIILKMDLKDHFQEIAMFKTKLASDFPHYASNSLVSGDFTGKSKDTTGGTNNSAAINAANYFEDVLVLLSITLKVADVSWACRPLGLMSRWSERMHDEFFAQGELEKEFVSQGFPTPSPFCDRDSTDGSKVTLGYLLVIVQPLTITYAAFLNNAKLTKDIITDGLEANRAYLQSWVS